MVVGTHKWFRLSCIIFGWMNHGPKKVQPICKLVGPFPEPTVSKVLREKQHISGMASKWIITWIYVSIFSMVVQRCVTFFFAKCPSKLLQKQHVSERILVKKMYAVCMPFLYSFRNYMYFIYMQYYAVLMKLHVIF